MTFPNRNPTTKTCQLELIGGSLGEPDPTGFSALPGVISPVQSDYSAPVQPSAEPSTKSGEDTRSDDPTNNNQTPGQPTQPNQNASITSFEGRRVETGTPYDMRRVISIGTASGSEITGQMSIEAAVYFVRSPISKHDLDEVLRWSACVQQELRRLIGDFQEKGVFDFEQPGYVKSLWRLEKQSLAREMTNLLKAMNGLGAEAIDKKIKDIAWRTAKKNRLPAFMWAGKFGVRSNRDILSSSGLMCIDLDKLEVDTQALMVSLKADPLLFWAARSPSKTGVKLLIRIPDDAACNEKKYLACFETFERYIAAKYPSVSINVDRQAKAIAQLCFFMHDPDSFCNPNSYILHPDEDLVALHVDGVKIKLGKPVNPIGAAADFGAGSQQQKKKGNAPLQPVGESKGFPFDSYAPEKQWETIRSAVESMEDWFATLPEGEGKRNKCWTSIGFAVGDWLKKIEDDSISDEVQKWLLELAAQY